MLVDAYGLPEEGLGLSYIAVVQNLNVNQSTVKRVVKLFADTGSGTKECYVKSGLPRKITKVVQFFILQYPGIKLSLPYWRLFSAVGNDKTFM